MTRLLAAVFLFASAAGNLFAQSFPARPLTLISPFPPASTTYQYLQAFAPIASKYVGQTIVLVSQPGENGTLGPATMAASAPPDGYSLALLPITAMRIPHMRRVSWDPLKDFTYVIGLAGLTIGIAVKSDSQFKTFQDFMEFAKANPGKLRYAVGEFGGSPHLVMEELEITTGAKFQRVLVRGNVEAGNALMEGRVLALSDTSSWGPRVDSGAFRLLVTFGERRSRWNAPTAMELGVKILSYSPFGIVAPKGMDPTRTKLLHDAFNRALDDPEYAELLKRFEIVDWYKSSEDYAEWAVDQFRFQRALIERTIGLGTGLQR